MIFATYWFLAFVAIFLPLYWVLPPTLRKCWLLLACVVFHGHFAGPSGVIPIVILGLITYFSGLSRARWACIGTMTLCVLALCFYKYTHFLSLKLIGFFSQDAGNSAELWLSTVRPALPPLAISFFTFEFVHYLYDVLKGKPSIRGPVQFALFSIFWPSLVAGPIKRYRPFLATLDRAIHLPFRWIYLHKMAPGLLQVCIGYIKKFAADSLTLYIDFSAPRFEQLTQAERWTIFLAIGFRILLDFSGYSDIAIGFARMMGIGLPRNFNWPYLAANLQEFWRRWHISLSSWIRDYIYIPLGGNRKGPARQVLNGIIAFGLCGLWHGPDWNFAVWGIYHGLGLAVNNSYAKIPFGIGSTVSFVFHKVKILSWLGTMFFVFAGWLVFFYPLPVAWNMLKLLWPF